MLRAGFVCAEKVAEFEVVPEGTGLFWSVGCFTDGASAASSNASIATCHAVVSCSDLGRVKICRLASSSVRSVLPSGKTTGRSRRLSQDTTQLRNRTLNSSRRGGAFPPGVIRLYDDLYPTDLTRV